MVKPVMRLSLLCLSLLAVLGICLYGSETRPAADAAVKHKAVELAANGLRLFNGRLPGPEYSLITTTLGAKDAKRLSLHPDFAAVTVDLLREAGIRQGDRVAVNVSGSFPGLNIAALAAVSALGAEPLLISSVGASSWGATDPADTWLDMEQSLIGGGLWPWRSLAASPGGVADRGGGLSDEGLALIRAAMQRNAVPELGSRDVADGVARRLAFYRDATGLPAALINVGGSHVIFGSSGHARPLRQGLTTGYRPAAAPADSLAAPFLAANRPVIHYINIRRLAARYHINADSPPGSAAVFYRRTLAPPLRALAAAALITAIVLLGQGRRLGWWKQPRRPSTGG